MVGQEQAELGELDPAAVLLDELDPDLALELRELLRLGLPIGGTYAVESGMFAFAALCMGAIGSDALAAHQIAIMSVYVAFMVPVGISYATTFRIGQHYGAGRLADARRAGRLGIGGGACCMLVFALLFWLAPEWVVGLFLDRHDPQFAVVVALAVSLLAVAAWFELFDGIQTIAMGAIRGHALPRTPIEVPLLALMAAYALATAGALFAEGSPGPPASLSAELAGRLAITALILFFVNLTGGYLGGKLGENWLPRGEP